MSSTSRDSEKCCRAMTLIVFEDEDTARFEPLASFRHVSQMCWGTGTLLEALRRLSLESDVRLWGRKEMAEVTIEKVGVPYNSSCKGEALFVNARARPTKQLQSLFGRKGNFAAVAGGKLVAARLKLSAGSIGSSPGNLSRRQEATLAKGLDRRELEESYLFDGPWEMVASNGSAIAEQVGTREFSSLPDKALLKGSPSNLRVADSAEIEGHVVFDARAGPVIIEGGATVESFSRLSGPCFVGRSSKVKSALIRSGTSLFESCYVGGEVANSILMPFTNKSHYGYVGDSIVGSWVNLGAGSTFSNIKNTYGNVKVSCQGSRFDTGMMHLGPLVGDMAKVSIGAMVHAGKVIGPGSFVAGPVREDVPAFTFYDDSGSKKVELKLDSVIETQKRMMERRGRTLGKAEEALISDVFTRTAADRRELGVKKGRLV